MAELVFKKELPRGQFCVYSSMPDFDFIKVKQTHSDIVLDENECLEKVADGMLGRTKRPMAILTADCLPILLLGDKEHALVHAGWKGLENGILGHELIKKIRPIYAMIGPHISVAHYEVQPDFKDNFPLFKNDPKVFVESSGKIFLNLSYIAHLQLESLYTEIKIEESQICTFQDERFHSYRRNKTQLRNWNMYIP
jgi:hypothetical protein